MFWLKSLVEPSLNVIISWIYLLRNSQVEPELKIVGEGFPHLYVAVAKVSFDFVVIITVGCDCDRVEHIGLPDYDQEVTWNDIRVNLG